MHKRTSGETFRFRLEAEINLETYLAGRFSIVAVFRKTQRCCGVRVMAFNETDGYFEDKSSISDSEFQDLVCK